MQKVDVFTHQFLDYNIQILLYLNQNICLRYIVTNDEIIIAMSLLTWGHLEEIVATEVGVNFATIFILDEYFLVV